jgi:hypothetical protein
VAHETAGRAAERAHTRHETQSCSHGQLHHFCHNEGEGKEEEKGMIKLMNGKQEKMEMQKDGIF